MSLSMKNNKFARLISIFISLSLFLSSSFAQIIPDSSAPLSNQPLILKSPNDALIVNIVTPNNKGVSFNEYYKFDTPPSGTVLNNSVNGANTQIGGFIEANPFLNGGAARLIVNQINSNDPSLLRGNLEIAGGRADLLIANPSGISVNGLNIINASSSTLTTARLESINGDISLNLNPSLLPNGMYPGSIQILGNGLNDNSNYTNIIANTLKIASNIRANELNLISSNDKIVSEGDRLFNKIKPNSDLPQDAPRVSIDSSALGGMYAGKINIIATKDGVGVNNAGIMAANEISINSNGDIINLNIVKAEKNIDISSNSNLINKDSATVSSLGDITIKANTVDNLQSSNIAASNNIYIDADTINNGSSMLLASNINVKAKNLNNFSQSEILTVTDNYSGSLNLLCCGSKSFKLSVDAKKIKEGIIDEWNLISKSYTDEELKTELYKRVISQDINAYALNLHISSYLHGTSSHPFNSIKIDEENNSVVINVQSVKDRERVRNLYYSISKEKITKQSLDNFIPAKIYASGDIDFNLETLINDKSYIYANNDIKLNANEAKNIGYDLQRNVNSYLKYEWKEKGKRKAKKGFRRVWVTKGGDSAHKYFNYTEDGLPAVLASNNNFYASLVSLSNASIEAVVGKSIDIPIFKPNDIPYVKYSPINTGFLYGMSGSSPAFILGKFQSIYSNAASLLNEAFNKTKISNGINKSSVIVAKNDISIDASGNVYNAGLMAANNLNVSANEISNENAALLAANNINLKSNDNLNLTSSIAAANDINLQANNININRSRDTKNFSTHTQTTLGASSNLNAKNDINIKSNDILISGANLKANDDINLNVNNSLNVKTAQSAYEFDLSGKDTKFKGSILTNQTSSLNAKNIKATANDINLVSANLNANEKIELSANNNIDISSANDRVYLQSEVTSKGFLSKKKTVTQSLKEDVLSSNLNANDISLTSNKDTKIAGSNLTAKDSIAIKADSIDLTPTAFSNAQTSQTTKSSFGGISKSMLNTADRSNNLQASNLNANNIKLTANDINLLASNIQATALDINTKILNLISSKSSNTKTRFKQSSGLITATITDKGKISEVEIPSIIKVKDRFILNGNDITDKLDTQIANQMLNALNSQEFKDNVIKELRSNSKTPLNEKTINQIKATLNSREWEEKTTTLSGIGSLITTLAVAYMTYGIGGNAAAGLGLVEKTASYAAVSSMTSAAITNVGTSLIASAISGKTRLDLGSLATSVATAGALSYANAAFGVNALKQDMKFYDYLKNATINGVGQGISSEVRGEDFKKGFITGAAISAISDSALQMRKYVAKHYDNIGDGKLSEGLRGDGAKIAGSHPEKVYENGVLKGEDVNAPTGGPQMKPGTLFGFAYSKGGIIDNTLERYAGPHDFMSSWNYENINGVTYLKDNGNLVNVASGLLLIPSVPFALAPFLEENFSSIEIYKDLKKRNKNIREDVIKKSNFK